MTTCMDGNIIHIFSKINKENFEYMIPKLVHDLEKMFKEDDVNKLFITKNFEITETHNSIMDCIEFEIQASYVKEDDEDDEISYKVS